MTDQQNKPSNQVGTVQAAARLAFQGSTATGAAKLRVCNQLLLTCKSTRYTPSTVQLPLEAAAQAAWMSPVGLLPILKADACFKVVETQSAAAASKGYVVALNCYAILDKARRNTTTGILTEELPPPKGYTDGVHPLRPGQPNCTQWMKFRQCSYDQRCVFNHPGNPSATNRNNTAATSSSNQQQQNADSVVSFKHRVPAPQQPQQQPGSRSNVSSSTTSAAAAAAAPIKPAWGGVTAGGFAAAGGGMQAAGGSSSNNAVLAQPNTPNSMQAANQEPPAHAVVHVQDAHTAQPQQQQQQQQQPDSQQQQQQLPPGFSAQHYQGRPCQMHMLRGFCPMGDRCPYDHPPRAGASTAQIAVSGLTATAAPEQQQQQLGFIAPVLTATAIATSSSDSSSQPYQPAPSVVSPLAAAATPATPAAAAPAAATATTSSDTGTSTDLPAAAAAVHRSWRALVAGQQEQDAGSPAAAAAHNNSTNSHHADAPAPAATDGAAGAGAGAAGGPRVPPERADKLMGWTDGNLPQLRGEPNCPFFMGTGFCKFKGQCVYHHPPEAEHPVCILAGHLPQRYNTSTNRPSYGRVVSYLYRMYDYDSCVEAQLKVWLAKHLLARNNPQAHMFDKSASKPVTTNLTFSWQAVGPYSCSMGEAGIVLNALWKAQPDAAASQPFPYSKRVHQGALKALLEGDPFFEVLQDKHCASHWWVRLNVEKIKSNLNF